LTTSFLRCSPVFQYPRVGRLPAVASSRFRPRPPRLLVLSATGAGQGRSIPQVNSNTTPFLAMLYGLNTRPFADPLSVHVYGQNVDNKRAIHVLIRLCVRGQPYRLPPSIRLQARYSSHKKVCVRRQPHRLPPSIRLQARYSSHKKVCVRRQPHRLPPSNRLQASYSSHKKVCVRRQPHRLPVGQSNTG
jgi:hypothetical protein